MAAPGAPMGFEDDQFGEDAAAAWYAQAAEDDLDEDDEEEEEEEEEAFEPDVPEDADAAEDPYLAVDSDPYGAVAADPYGSAEDGAVAVQESSASHAVAPPVDTPPAPKLSGSGSAASVATATALAAAFAVAPAGQANAAPKEAASPAQARRLRRSAATALPGEEVAPWRQPQRKVQKTHSQFVSASLPPPAPPMPPVTPQTTPIATQLPPAAPVVTASTATQLPPAAPVVTAPDPVPMQTEESVDQGSIAEQATTDMTADTVAAGEALDEMQEEVPDGEQDDGNVEEDMSWDERVVVVRQGQVHIELQHRNPPMQDSALLRFCDWLDKQMPLVVENFPYVQKSGAYVDLSDNVIGPEGLDKLFRVLRDHRVPCVVMKAYRNVLDDSIVDTLIEYLYTQPESFPMHGIHISHNSITDKGANRLIRAAAQCGHYPRLTSRLPLWLRLESNHIANPQKVVADCLADNFHVCLMKDGLCSRPDCNHMSDVHIQLPYFFNQKRIVHDVQMQPAPRPSPGQMQPAPRPSPGQSADGAPLPPEQVPDWMTLRSVPAASVLTGIPAPKKQDFRPPAPRVGQPPQAQRKPQVPKSQGRMMPAQRLMRPPPPVMAAPVEVPSWEGDSPAMAAPVEAPSLEDPLGPDIAFASASSGRPKLMNTTAKARGGAPDSSFSWNNDFSANGAGAAGDVWGGSSPGTSGNGWGGKGKGGAWRQGGGKGEAFGANAGGWQPSWKQDWGGKDGGKRSDSKGKARGKGGGRGKGKKGDWKGPTLVSKLLVKRDIQLSESDLQLGFQWRYVGEGSSPCITAVDPNSKVGQIAQVGASLLRVNGLDSAMFTEKQVTDMLKQRPISLRIGDQ